MADPRNALTAAFRARYAYPGDFVAYVEMVAATSDAEAAATMVDHLADLLDAMVQKRLPDRPTTGIGDRLSDAVLARSWTCFRLGLLTEDEHRECELLAKAESQLATGDARHFEDVAGLTSALTFATKYEDNTSSPARTRFMTSAAALITEIVERTSDRPRRKRPDFAA